MKCCPKCGGTSGYARLFTVKTLDICFWNHEDDETTSDNNIYEDGHASLIITCRDCNKKMRIDKIKED